MAILATDNFTRANNADLGAAWDPNTGESGPNGFTISANTAVPSNLALDSSETNNTVTWPNDQYAECTYGATAADGAGTGSGVTCREATGATVTYYRAVGNASGFQLSRSVVGAFTNLSSGTTTTFAAGDKLRLEVVTNGANADWTLKKNGVSFATGSDTAPIASGRAGIGHSSTSTVTSLSAWEAGDLTTASTGQAASTRGRAVTMGPRARRMAPQTFPTPAPIDTVTPTPTSTPFRIGRAGTSGMPTRRMFPQQAPDTIQFVQDGSATQTPFRIGRGGGIGTPVRRMFPQRYPDTSVVTNILAPSEGSIVIAGAAASITLVIAAIAGAIVIAGNTPSITTSLQATEGAIVISGNAPSTTMALAATVGSVVIGGAAPNISSTLVATEGAVIIGGNSPSIGAATFSPTEGTITIDGSAPSVTLIVPAAITERFSGGWEYARRARKRLEKELRTEREKWGILPKAAQVVAAVAIRQADALDLDAEQRLEELERELKLAGVRYQAQYLELLNLQRQRLIDAEIRGFFEAEEALDEENKRRLMLLLAFLS